MKRRNRRGQRASPIAQGSKFDCVPGGEDVARFAGQILGSIGPVAERKVQDRPRNEGDRGVEERGPGRTGHRRRVSRIGATALWWRAEMAAAKRKLVIVESPAKAKTIAGYLGNDYMVESSIGHIRDLPNNASEIPAKYKEEAWARLGVDTAHDFAPLYVVDARKKKVVSDLKAKLKDADELLLATDEDREGEAIAWHLTQVLDPKVPVRRMVFHEITKQAIEHALTETRDIDQSLVDAQETRRILDRLYGYEVSPVLWRKIMQGLSAGRVQSVATRLVVERERERMLFVAADYWDIVATFAPGEFTARLAAVDGRRVAQGTRLQPRGRAEDRRHRAARPRTTRAASPPRSRAPTSRSPRSRRSRTRGARRRRS